MSADKAAVCPLCLWDLDASTIGRSSGAEGVHTVCECVSCGSWFVPERILADHKQAWLSPHMLRYMLETQIDAGGAAALLLSLNRPRGSRLLHLGCGLGVTVDMAVRTGGWTAFGLDSSQLAAEGEFAFGDHVQQIFIAPNELPDGPFDAIIISGALERVEDPHELLRAVASRMAPEGELVIEMLAKPRGGPFSAVLGEAAHRKVWPTAHGVARMLRVVGLDRFKVTDFGSTIRVASIPPDAAAPRTTDVEALCTDYLNDLLAAQPMGSPVWNGAAANLLHRQADAGSPLEQTVYADLQACWTSRCGVDLGDPDSIPSSSPEEIASVHVRRQPFILGPVLFDVARLRTPELGALSTTTLAYYRKAFLVSLETSRVLQTFGVFDEALKTTLRTSRKAIANIVGDYVKDLRHDADINALSPLPMPPSDLLMISAAMFHEPVQTFAHTLHLESKARESAHILQGQLEACERRLALERAHRDDMVRAFRTSTSWRISAPVRWLGHLARRASGRRSTQALPQTGSNLLP